MSYSTTFSADTLEEAHRFLEAALECLIHCRDLDGAPPMHKLQVRLSIEPIATAQIVPFPNTGNEQPPQDAA